MSTGYNPHKEYVYAVIDLGTSYIRGLIAQKLDDGEISPIACETLPSDGYIKHGAVYNIDGVAEKIRTILDCLNEHLEDNYIIDRLYIGVGAQSIRSEEAVIKIDLDENGEEITDLHLEEVVNRLQGINYPRRVIIDYLDPYYEIDGKIESFPRSVVCHEFVAHVSLITIKDWIYNNIRTVVEDRLGLKLADVLVTPLCEANVMLSPSQRQLGSVFVNIGGGTSSVVIFLGGVFRRLRVLPFGGENVSKDLESLHLTPEMAEKIKLDYSGATTYADRDLTFEIPNFDGIGMRSMRVLDVNRYTSARMREITENIIEVVKKSGMERQINAGYLFTGGGTKIKRFDELLKTYTRHSTFNTQIGSIVDHNNALVTIPGMETSITLAYAATENCITPKTLDLKKLTVEAEERDRNQTEIKQHDLLRKKELSHSGNSSTASEYTPSARLQRESFQQDPEPREEYEDLTENKIAQSPSIAKKISGIFEKFKEKFKEDPEDNEEL